MVRIRLSTLLPTIASRQQRRFVAGTGRGSVKAALITRGIDPPRWHDIDSLITLLGGADPVAVLLAPLAGLTPYGIAFRYPVPDPEALPPIPTAEELLRWLTVLEDARAAVGKAARDTG